MEFTFTIKIEAVEGGYIGSCDGKAAVGNTDGQIASRLAKLTETAILAKIKEDGKRSGPMTLKPID